MNVTVELPLDVLWLIRISAVLFIVHTLASLYGIYTDERQTDLLTKLVRRVTRKEHDG